MRDVTVIIPNYNGIEYIGDCIESLLLQTMKAGIMVVDNASADGSADVIRAYPEVELVSLDKNYGFCRAVNEGIRRTTTRYIVLLNNDTKADPDLIRQLYAVMEENSDTFSVASKMLQMRAPDRIDSAGDLYCALGWAFSPGRDKSSSGYTRGAKVFSACAGAAMYRTGLLKEIGCFDEMHVSYLEDVDVGYRARIRGYVNRYAPDAVVYHAGSATTGSRYNTYKVRQAARNSVYMPYKNMPLLQLLLNAPLLLAGYVIKALFFTVKGFGISYISGIIDGCRICTADRKTPFKARYLPNYCRIQLELWINVIRRITG